MKKRIMYVGVMLALFATVFQSCQEETEVTPIVETTSKVIEGELQELPVFIPDATVGLRTYPAPEMSAYMVSEASCSETVSPATFMSTLQEEESVNQSITACLDGLPPKGDVLFVMDLTGSMGGELANLKVNAINIMNSVKASIPDSQFGLVSYLDYTEQYTSCGYTTTYGSATSGDYPYNLDQGVTDNLIDVSNAINSLELGWGGDYPESSSRALFETYSDDMVGWRDGAAKIIIHITDAVTHDCNPPAPFSGASYGSDPGRDGIMGTADDIIMADVISELQAQDITLITLSSGGTAIAQLWENYSAPTGGTSFQINYNGTIPDGGEIDALVTDLIEETVSSVSSLSLTTSPAGFETWISSVAPAEYTSITLDASQSFDFDVEFTVPAGTPDGIYEFELVVDGDGAAYGSQMVTITVLSDSDGDSCNDDEDPYPNSNMDETIVIDGCDSGVENQFVDDCTTMMDLILECANNAANHGDFVSCLSGLTNSWKSQGLITGREKGKIQSCGGQSSWPN